ncbi:TIGR04222 domain-containing membrane protein [Streptomyces sp. NPDC086023]|uniref:TIGR04222 domain-containing membrane protein n=1 Tax=Streptomyces sp. NPDC086023 TaxID=3365746 RepID=UPI0037D83F74
MNVLAVLVWAAVIGSTTVLAVAVRRRRGSAGATPAVLHDLTEVAFLSGGPRRVVDTALVGLCYDGRMMIGGPGIVQVRSGARAADPVERAVLAAHQAAPSGALQWLRLTAVRDPAVQETGDALAARGLLSAPGEGEALKRWALAHTLVCLFMMPVAFFVTVAQWASTTDPYVYEFDVPFFVLAAPALFLGFVAGAFLRVKAAPRITAAGAAALRAYTVANVSATDPQVLVALNGPRRLPDPLLRAQLLQPVGAVGRGGRRGRAGGGARHPHSSSSCGSGTEAVMVWCSTGDSGGGWGTSCGASGSSCGSSGSGCGSSSSSCGSSGSSCSSSGSSCGSSSGSSCGSSSS